MTTPTITASISATIVTQLPEDFKNHVFDFTNPHRITCETINAFPNQEGIVIDTNYIHTDNNFTTEHKTALDSLLTNGEVLENLGELSSQITEMEEKITTTSTNLTSLAKQHNATKVRVTNNETAISNLQNNITTLQEDLSTEISEIQNSIGSNIDERINSKVDKVEGKGLSTEDFTSEYKAKLENMVANKNFLFNPDFKINQRQISELTTGSVQYCVDRWVKEANTSIQITSEVLSFANNSSSELSGIGQYIVDHSELLGNAITLAVKLKDNDTIYTLTSDILPLDTASITNTVLKTVTTDFGALQLEFAESHFYVRILQNATTQVNYLSLEWAKLEKGNGFTGFDTFSSVEELDKCCAFYQPYYSGKTYLTGFRILSRTTTFVNFHIHLDRPMYSRPTIICPSKTIMYYMEGSDQINYTFNNCSVSSATDDNRILLACFSELNNNSETLNGKNFLYNWCGGRFDSCFFEAEIFS